MARVDDLAAVCAVDCGKWAESGEVGDGGVDAPQRHAGVFDGNRSARQRRNNTVPAAGLISLRAA